MPAATSSPIPLVRSPSSALLIAASSLAGMAGYGFYSGLPVILGALSDSRGIASASLGWIASAEILGLLLGGLVATWLTASAGGRLLCALGLGLVGASHLVSMSTGIGLEGLIAARLLGGLGGGCIYAVGVSALASTPSPARSVAIFTAVLAAAATTEVGVMPLIVAHFGVSGVFWTLLCLSAVSLPFISALPARNTRSVVTTISTATPIDKQAWVMLAGMACFHVAPVIYWTYGERIGVGSGIAETTLGIIFTISGVLGAAACFSTEAIARRLGQGRALQLTTVVLSIGLLSWLVGSLTPITYFFRSCLVGIPWILGGVFQVNVANEIDPSGRLSALVGPAQNVGLMVGPAIASTLMAAGQGFSVVLAVATAILAISLLLTHASRRRRLSVSH